MTPLSGPQHVGTILIIDSDLGFLIWLGLWLASAGYLTIPATNCRKAQRLVRKLQNPTIDLVIINMALPGAFDLVGALRSRYESLMVMSIEDQDRSARPASQAEWLSKVRRALAQEGRTSAP